MLKAIILHKPCIYDEPLLAVMQEHASRAWSAHLSLSSYGFLYVWALKEHKPENPTSSLFYWRLSSYNVVSWRKPNGFKWTKVKVPNVTWPQGFVWRLNKWSMHQVDISLCQSNVHNCSKIKSLSLSIHFRTTQHWAMQTQQGLPINAAESSGSWEKALQEYHAPIFWRGTSVVLAHMCPRQNKDMAMEKQLLFNVLYIWNVIL